MHMRGKNLFDGLGSFIKNSFLTGSDGGVNDVIDDDHVMSGRFPGNDFESHNVPTANGTAKIFVTRRSLASYFNDEAEYSPTIIATPRESYSYTQRKHTIDTLTGESPADLFINAVRKPARQITDDMEPVIIRKEIVEPIASSVDPTPVIEPVVQIAEMPVESITAMKELEPVVSTPSETPVISIEEVAVEAMEIEESSVEHALSQLASITEIEKEAIPQTMEIKGSSVDQDLSQLASLVDIEEEVVPQTMEIGASSVDQGLSQLASLVDIEEEVVPQTMEIEVSSVDQGLSQLASLVDIDEEVVPQAIEEVASETVEESVPASQLLLAPTVGMLALPPKLEIKLISQATVKDEEQDVEAEPIVVEPSLPEKIEIEEIEPLPEPETSVVDFVNPSPVVEATETSSAVEEITISQDILTGDSFVPVPTYPVEDLDRDVLLAFYPELKEESEEFILTSMDNNTMFPEDKLDRTECTFKLKVRRVYPVFDGYTRHIANH